MLRRHPGPLLLCNCGFTLMEILAAIALMGILAAVAMPNWGSLISTYRLNAAGRQLYADLQRARMRAVMENTGFNVNVSSAPSSSYEFRRSSTVLETKPLPDGIVIQATSTLSFTTRGTADSGRIQLCNSVKDERTDVVVNGVGRVSICQVNSCSGSNC